MSDQGTQTNRPVWPPAPRQAGDSVEPKAAPRNRLRYLWLLIPYFLLIPYVWGVTEFERLVGLFNPAASFVLFALVAAAGVALAISFRLARLRIGSRIAYVIVLAAAFFGATGVVSLGLGSPTIDIAIYAECGACFAVLIALGIGLETFVGWLVSILRPKPLAP